MPVKPTYEELEERVKALEKEARERRRSDESTHEALEDFKALADNAGDGIAVIASNGAHVYVNRRAAEISGYTVEELLAVSMADLIHPDARKNIKELFRKRIEGESVPTRHETVIIRKDGKSLPVEASGARTTWHGQPADVVFSHDITRRKQMEEALRRANENLELRVRQRTSELSKANRRLKQEISLHSRTNEALARAYAELQQIFRTNTGSMWVLDKDFNIIRINDAFLSFVGMGRDEALSRKCHELLRIPFCHTEDCPLTRILAGEERIEFDIEIELTDGTSAVCMLTATPFLGHEGQIIGIVQEFKDITNRRLTAKALYDEKEKFRVLVEESPLGVALIANDGLYKYLNPRFTEIFGYTLKDIPSGHAWFEKAFPDKEYRSRVISAWIEDYNEAFPGDFRPRTYRVICRDGSEKLINFRPVTVSSGDQLVIYEDITEKNRLHAQRFQAQKMSAVATLAGGIAQLFNKNLTLITGYANLLETEFPNDKKITELVNPIKKSAHQMDYLTSQLLAYAKGGKYDPVIVSLADLVKDILPSIKPVLGADITLETDLAGDCLSVEADRSQIQMVLSSIVSNSNDAIEGEGLIRVIVRNKEILGGNPELQPGSYVCLIVEDDGKGMDKETKDRIFDPFFSTHFVGRGLSMAAVHGIVRNHNGWIAIESELGKGTVVSIYLPTAERLEAPGKPVIEQESGVVKGEGVVMPASTLSF